MRRIHHFFMLLILLLAVSLLPSCAAAENKSPAVPDVTGIAEPSPVAPASDAAPVIAVSPVGQTPEDIENQLKQKLPVAEVLGTADIGAGFRLVEFYVETAANGFALWDMKTGVLELLPVQDVALLKAVNENYFIFEDRGEYTDSAFRFFPEIVRCFRIASGQEYDNFKTITETEYFVLDRSVQAGSKNDELLSAVAVTLDGLQVIFKPSGANDGAFYADATDIPRTITSFEPETCRFTVEIATAALDPGIKTGIDIPAADNLYISSYKITVKDGRTYITATLRDGASRYAIQVKKGPLAPDCSGELPYITLTFSGAPDLPLDY